MSILSQVAHLASTNIWLPLNEVTRNILLSPGWDVSPSQVYPSIKFPSIHYLIPSRVCSGTLRVLSCTRTQHHDSIQGST